MMVEIQVLFISYINYMQVMPLSAHSDYKENDVALRLLSYFYGSILHGFFYYVSEDAGTRKPNSTCCIEVGNQQPLCK